ncbi:MAG: precorrin-8X methylmutase, partial [Aedoeadaptatus pacaensis]
MYEKKPMAIERTSMDIIDEYLGDVEFRADELPVVRRMIHTTGDVEYRHIIDIHEDFMAAARAVVKSGGKVYTDTNMVRAGINKKALAASGVELVTLISDDEVAKIAAERKTTRSIVAMEEAASMGCEGFII